MMIHGRVPLESIWFVKKIRQGLNEQTSCMKCQKLDTYNGPLVLYPFILSDINQLFELHLTCLEAHCI